MDTTIKDIAKEANVSYATVSRALNGKYGVKKETRDKILEIANDVGYTPNALARGLVKKESFTLGLVIPDITNPFFPEVERGIEDGAKDEGYNVILCNTNWEKDREDEYIDLLIEKRVSGIIIAPISENVTDIEEKVRDNIPIVYVSNSPRETRHQCVEIDNVLGGFIATKRLIDLGYEKIGYIGASRSYLFGERLEGYKEAFKECNKDINEKYIKFGDYKQTSGYNIIKEMIIQGNCPEAVFAENDLLAMGVMQGAKEMGLKVPGDIAVVGFDDIPFASFPEIQLTTINQPKYDMGIIAAKTLIDKIKEGSGLEKRGKRIILEPSLVVRKSCY